MLETSQLRDRIVVEKNDAISVPIKRLLPVLLWFLEKDIFCYVLITGAAAASMTGKSGDCIDNEWRIEKWLEIRSGLQNHKHW